MQPLNPFCSEEDNDEYDLSELTETNIKVEFTEDQFNNLYRLIKANQHQNKDLPEILTVLQFAIINRYEAKSQMVQGRFDSATSNYLAMSEDYLNMSKETPEQEANRILELSNRLSSIAVEGIDLLLDDECDDECQTAQGRFDSATSSCPCNEQGFTDK